MFMADCVKVSKGEWAGADDKGGTERDDGTTAQS